jgi:hypothetical protein
MRYLDECRFGTISAYNLSTCSARLQRFGLEAIRRTPRHLDWAITCGWRNQKDQVAAFNARPQRSKKRWPESMHNVTTPDGKPYSRAFDIRPASPFTAEDWADRLRFARIIGFLECVAVDLGERFRFGIDFDGDGRSIDESFIDIPHIEEA